MSRYELVSIREFNGVEDGAFSWTFLSYAILVRGLDGQVVCLSDETKTYDCITDDTDRLTIPIGSIVAYPESNHYFDSMRFKSKKTLKRFMKNSDLYFDDDTKYAKDIIKNEDIKGYVKK